MFTLVIALVLPLTGAVLQGADTFDLPVYRARLLRDEPGRLAISTFGVRYTSENGKTIIELPLSEIREADISNPRELRLEAYDILKMRLGGRKTLAFRLREEKHAAYLARFFAEHLKRPVVGAYSLPEKPVYEIPAYHKQALGGSHGTLEVGPAGIRFESKNPKDSRTWLYRDIETFGAANPFHLRISTFTETYTFDLKERLREEAYSLVWQRVYGAAERKGTWNEK